MGSYDYKLLSNKNDNGVWVNRTQLLKLIKICKGRSNYYHTKLIEWYEHLEQEKFDEDLLKDI